MKHVQGIGGIFIKAQDPERMLAWYDEHLGISPLPHSPWGPDDDAPLFEWRDKDDPERLCYSVFGVFPMDSDFFDPGTQPYILGFRVHDLDALLEELQQSGTKLHGDVLKVRSGRMARIIDPEGNPIGLWEPAEGF